MANTGDVVIVDFRGVQGVKRRPAVVVSSDLYHKERPDIIVGMLTSQLSSATSQSDHILHDWRTSGLRVSSAFRSFLLTMPQHSIIVNVGRTSDRDWQAIAACLRIAVAS